MKAIAYASKPVWGQARVSKIQNLIEPLSSRELEVLGLIAAGMSNQEIAERLIISVNTVKRHASNIYGKLGVQNRTNALLKSRELDLGFIE